MSKIALAPVTLKEANAYIAEFHSHHKPVIGWKFGISALVDGVRAGVVVIGRPSAQALDNGRTLEVTRLCCRGGDKNVASRLLGAASRAAAALGYLRLISYTRVDEPGTCYRAANWEVRHRTKGQEWTSGNKRTRWLPGLYEPSTEIVDRFRWEIDLSG